MNIAVVGAGRTGIFWATIYARGGAQVTLLVRPRQRRYFTRDTPPTIEWMGNGEVRTSWIGESIAIVSDTKSLDPSVPWCVVLAVRSYAIEAALKPIAQHLGDSLKLVIVPTNGMSGEKRAYRVYPYETQIICATLTLPCDLNPDYPNRTRVFKSDGGIGFAYYDDICSHSHFAEEVNDILANLHGIEIAWYESWRSMKWTKNWLNLLNNSLPAITNMEPTEVYANYGLCRLELRFLAEAISIGRYLWAEPVELPGYPLTKINQLIYLARLERYFGWTGLPAYLYQRYITPRILKARGGKKPSLLAEIQAGATQCENLHASLREGTENALLNAALGHILDDCFLNPTIRKRYDHAPEELLRELKF